MVARRRAAPVFGRESGQRAGELRRGRRPVLPRHQRELRAGPLPAADLAGEPEQQDLELRAALVEAQGQGLQRRHRPAGGHPAGPAPCASLRRQHQVDLAADEQHPGRGGLRVGGVPVAGRRPAGHGREHAVHARVVCHGAQDRQRAQHQPAVRVLRRLHGLDLQRPRRAAGEHPQHARLLGVVRDRQPQSEVRGAGRVRPRRPQGVDERRSGRELPERQAEHGDGEQHAVHRAGPHRSRRRRVRAGLLDDQAAHAQSGGARGVFQGERQRNEHGCGAVRAGAVLP